MRSALISLSAACALLLAIPHAQARRTQAQVSTATYSSTTHAKSHLRRAAVRHASRVAQVHRRAATATPAS